ncbi:MAG: helix-hairpin-helix domain-containing protein [Vicinamibacterales bacterium]
MTVRQFLAACAIGSVLLGSAATAGAAPAKRKTTRTHAAARTVDVNSASKSRLTTLPGIDAGTADKIIAGRPYGSGNDLVSKNVLSADAFEKIKGRVVARKAVPRKAAGKKRRAARRKAQPK